MRRVLVTGGAGFIGSHVAAALLQRGCQVTVFDDLSGGFRQNVPEGAEFVPGSVADDVAVSRLFAEGRFTHVFHLAAYAAEGLSHFIKRFNYTNNVIGSVTLLNAAVNAGVELFVFTSSIAVYGASAELPVTESTPVHPGDSYGIAKHAIELELHACREMFGLDFVIFRPHNVFGPRQNIGDPYRNVVGIFMNQILQGQPMTVFGDGTQTRAFSYVDDVAEAIAASIEAPAARNQVFNVGADRACTVAELARMVAVAMGVAPDIRHLPPRHEVAHVYASHARAAATFPDAPRTSLEDGLARMAAWVRRHGARTGEPFRAIEIAKNLPPSWQSA